MWQTLTAAEKAYVYQFEQDRKEGKKTQGGGFFERAFDDMTDPENIGFIPQRMKKLSKD